MGKGNEVLRRAMSEARLREVDVASHLGVDPKTVQRWVAGRLPHARHRWAVASLVGRHEYDLWPELLDTPPSTVGEEVVATYGHRSAVPREVWRALFAGAREEIGILVYSGLFLAEDVEVHRTLTERAEAGVRVRVLLGDPDSPQVAERGREEGITDALAAKVRNALVLYRPLLTVPGVEVRLHATVLYASLYIADEEMLVNQHVYGMAAAHCPVLHLRRTATGDDLTRTYRDAFERVWSDASPVPAPLPVAALG
jgi:hypothetical protein